MIKSNKRLRSYVQAALQGEPLCKERFKQVLADAGYQSKDIPRILHLTDKIRNREQISPIERVGIAMLSEQAG
jgi:uncharacterized protein Smg (DUF494 family)